MMNDNVNMEPLSNKQNKVIEKLEEVLLFLKNAPIKNDNALDFIIRPLNDIQSCLKFLPTEPSFEMIPVEVKKNIFDYLCDSNAFIVASVCQEWKDILENRFIDKELIIGDRCCNKKCTDNMCSGPSQVLKALATHKMDVDISINNPVKAIDPKIVTEALKSVSKFTINGVRTCTCYYRNVQKCDCDLNPLSIDQFNDLFQGLENKENMVEEVELMDLNLSGLNQDRLVNCFINKVKNITLRQIENHYEEMFDMRMFFRKLLQDETVLKLTSLTLINLCSHDIDSDLISGALCKIENVTLSDRNFFIVHIINKLIDNILNDTSALKIKTLIIDQDHNYGHKLDCFISTDNIVKLFNKMIKLQLRGNFNLEQVEAANSLQDTEVLVLTKSYRPRFIIRKGF